MAREILFKAKRTDNGEWVEGSLITGVFCRLGQDIPYIFCPKEADYDCFEDFSEENGIFEAQPDTICQYTGLTDKNGKKIWENDIVKYHFGEEVAPVRFGKYQSCFDSAKTAHIGFYVDWNNNKALRKDLGYWVNMIDCNVIGNIFDNPELLGGADNG